MKTFLQEKFPNLRWKKTLCIVGGVVLLLIVFQAGVHVGYHKAAFSYSFGDNYYRNFGERHDGRGPFGMEKERFSEAHGALGKIISITASTLIVEDKDNIEKIIIVNDDTTIKRFRDNATIGDLKVSDFIVVIGSPNDQSQIEAKLIRILPPPPDWAKSSPMREATGTNTPQ